MDPVLWLLLPVAAASGWWAARTSARKESIQNSQSSRVNQHCIQGLNYVLSEQSDKAIEMLVELVDVDEDTVETHIVLGSLFRGRGEVDRAIRVHQNIIARPAIPAGLKNQALLQLGIDYFKAGLLDRAENIFDQLSDADSKDPLLYEYQCKMFEQEQEWGRAIESVNKLVKFGNTDQTRRLSHYFCEQVEQFGAVNRDQALKLTRKAIQVDDGCIRAYMQQGYLLSSLGRYKDALRCYRSALEKNRSFIPLVLKQAMELFRANGELEKFPNFIRSHSELETNAAARFFLVQAYELLGAREEVERLLQNELSREEASPYIVKEYLQWMQRHTEGDIKESFTALSRVLKNRLSTYSACHCTQCGFEANALFWQCPGCQGWGSVEPYQNPVEYSWLD
ncbi:MAG: hypothetical protein ACWA5X_13830 [bacterium]